MSTLILYNTLSRSKEPFRPLHEDYVGLYTCGPTVYNYAHIGNLRTYLFEDTLKRVLLYNDFRLKHVMNITDVGHLTGDRDMGEDKMEKGAAREGKTAWDIAEFYTRAFQKDMDQLNILPPDVWCKATDTIPDQVALIRTLEEKGYTYQTGRRDLLRYFPRRELRQTVQPESRCAPGGGPGGKESREAQSDRFCTVEIFTRRRQSPNGMGFSLGQGFPWLAHRMFDHEHEVFG